MLEGTKNGGFFINQINLRQRGILRIFCRRQKIKFSSLPKNEEEKRMKSFLRRCLALALVLALSLTSGISAFAASADFEGEVISIDNAITAEPSGKNTLIKDELAASVKDFSGVKENEKVTFIVELEGESVLEAKPEEVSASDYMDTFEGDQTLNEIKSVQGEVQRKLNSAKTGLKVEFNYSVVMNGFAVSGPYSAKAYLESIPGVKAVYVANTYDIPETFDAADYATITSGVMLDSDVANANGYTGKGTVTAVLDTGLDLEHQAFANAPADPTLSLSDIEAAVASGNLNAGAFAADELYISEKVPFAFDYAEYDAQVNDPNDHGTHVCGTVGADCDEFKGVAPDTQIVIMKVFNDQGSGATDAVIFAALEDAVVLGVDAINMSLGTPGGFTYEDEITEAVYGAVKAAGINLMISAGNETDSVYNTESLYGYALTSNPDSGIVGSPSTYDAALSVASVNEYQDYTAYILAGENKIQYTDSNSGTNVDFVKTFDGQTLEYVVVPGLGAVSDYEGLDVAGKIALVSRGEIAFTEKEANAAAAGAIGLIVYDNVYASLGGMIVNGVIPSIMITLADGEILMAQEVKEISVSADYNSFINVADGGLMSSFSSLGTTPDLSIKPEITAPGGYVYSTLPGGIYGSMSGTSMAAPHMAGAAAVMQQYVDEEFAGLSATEKQELINTLLMNTAVQVTDEYGFIAAVRKQGAGLAQVNKAIRTGAYVTVDGSERPKAELGDSADGNFDKVIDLTIHNFSDADLTYDLYAVALSSYITSDGYDYYILPNQRAMGADEVEINFDENRVTVPAGSEASVSVAITLTEAGKENLSVFENGTFIEGYVFLEAADADGVDLSVPYLGFYGDWGKAPVFDKTIYDEELANVYTGATLALDATGSGFYLGMNMFDGYTDAATAAISAAMVYAGYYPYANIGLLRAPKVLTYTVANEAGEDLDIFALSAADGYIYYYGKEIVYENVIKSFYYSSGGFINSEYAPTYDGWLPIDAEGYFLPEGQYYINVEAQVDGTDSPAGTQNISYPVYMDNTAPKVTGVQYATLDGQYYVAIDLYDNHYAMGFQLISADGTMAFTEATPVHAEKAGETVTLVFNTTPLVEAGIEYTRLVALDYAQNESVSYVINLNGENAYVDIVEENLFAFGAEEFIVEAVVMPQGDGNDEVVWTSSDESIVTVEAVGERYDEETGLIYHRALVTTYSVTGRATITATNPNNGLTDSCSVLSINGNAVHNSGSNAGSGSVSGGSSAEGGEETDSEFNPSTGAPVEFNVLGAMAVLAAAVVAGKKMSK